MNAKAFFCGAIFAFFFFSFVSAAYIDGPKELLKGENSLIKIEGNFVYPLTEDQIHFYREQYMNTEFGDVGFKKIEQAYYIYFTTPLTKQPGNYTLKIEDVSYIFQQQRVDGDLIFNFQVSDEMVPFLMSPSFVIAHEKYSVTLENLMDKKITIEHSFSQIENESEQTDTNQTTENETEEESFFESLFSSDETNQTTENETNSSTMTGNAISSEPISLNIGETKEVEFIAPKEQGFEKLTLYYEDQGYSVMVYNPEEREEIENETTNETQNNETVNQTTQNETINVNETEKLGNETQNDSFVIDENGSIINKSSNKTIGTNLQNCSQLNGTICDWGQEKCSSTPLQVKDGNCCLDGCVPIQESNTGKIVGWSIIIAIVLFLTWFFKKKYSRVGK